MSQEEHVHDAGGPVAPVDQSIALVAQRGRKVPRAEPLVSDVIDAGTDQLRQDISVHVCSWLDQERRNSEGEQLEEAATVRSPWSPWSADTCSPPHPPHLHQQVIDAGQAVGGAHVLLLVPLVQQRTTVRLLLLC